MLIPIDRLRSGESGEVREITGGRGMVQRLETMGVRPGKVLVKVSAVFMGGPVTVMVDGREMAMGRGIARRVFVEKRQAK